MFVMDLISAKYSHQHDKSLVFQWSWMVLFMGYCGLDIDVFKDLISARPALKHD